MILKCVLLCFKQICIDFLKYEGKIRTVSPVCFYCLNSQLSASATLKINIKYLISKTFVLLLFYKCNFKSSGCCKKKIFKYLVIKLVIKTQSIIPMDNASQGCCYCFYWSNEISVLWEPLI